MAHARSCPCTFGLCAFVRDRAIVVLSAMLLRSILAYRVRIYFCMSDTLAKSDSDRVSDLLRVDYTGCLNCSG